MFLIMLFALKGNLSFNVSQNYYNDAWVGSETGSIVWMFLLDAEYQRNLPASFVLKNTFKSGYGQTYSQSIETGKWSKPSKSTDRIEDELLIKLVKGWAVDPFASITFQSQFYDNSIQDSVFYINPITLTYAIGASRDIIKNDKQQITTRIGFATKQNFIKWDLNTTDGGLEWITEGNIAFNNNMKYKGILKVYKAFFSSNPDSAGYWKSPDADFENTLTMIPIKFIQIVFNTRFIYERQQIGSLQIKEILSLGINIPF